jgi:DNA-binding beta-propeller fold protein YncE
MIDIRVIDQNNFKIHKFTKDGKFIKSWGSKGSGEGQFRSPYGLAIDSTDKINLVDSGNHRVQQFDIEGNFIKIWASDNLEEGPTVDPRAIDIDSSGNFYVADRLNFHQKERLRLLANDTGMRN